MSIQFGTGVPQQSSSTKMQDGVFIDTGVIKAAQILYNAKKQETWQPNDVALRLALGIEGLKFDKELWIAGDWRKEPTPQGGQVVVGAGSAFKVLRVFDELRIEGTVGDDGRFAGEQDLLSQMIGRQILVLSYAAYLKDNGKVGYRDYEIVAAVQDEENEEEARQRLFKSWTNDEYVQKKYAPELLTQGGDDSFDFSLEKNGVGVDDDIFSPNFGNPGAPLFD